MYRVVNQLTWQEFTVQTRDELYQELELLNARKNALDTRDEYQVSSVTEDGEIVDERRISIPFPAGQTVDELLLDFDERKVKSVFSSIVDFVKKKRSKPSVGSPVTSNQRNSEGPEEKESSSEDNLAAHVAPQEPASVGNEYQIEEEAPAQIPSKLPEPEVASHQADTARASVSLTENYKVQGFSVDVRETSQVLMQSFLTTIDHEVEEIDGLIERLQRERENRLRMRQALIDTTLL